MTLHCVFTLDPSEGPKRLQQLAAEDDAVLFLGVAVRLAHNDHPSLELWKQCDASLWVLDEDLLLYGVDVVAPFVRVTDSAGFVALAVEHTRQLAWR